jgi:DNA helicase-2/ATP-dependent DNA helicase PcrA
MPIDIDQILHAELTDEQRAAVIDPALEILCLACAGSGKSRTLAYRIACLVARNEPPESIVAFTFTDKAAETIKRRVSEALSKLSINTTVMGAMYIGTIHSYCHHILGDIDALYRQFDVLDDNRLKLYLISRSFEINWQSLRPRARRSSYFHAIKELSDAWKTVHDELIQLPDVIASDPELGSILMRLDCLLKHDQFIDFSLMIRKVVDALRANEPAARLTVSKLRHLLVDEYQDISPNQEELIRQLHGLSETLFVVGDDDQAIHSWRGADVRNILDFERRYPNSRRHTLSENFRSTSAIVNASNDFISGELGPSRFTKSPQAVHNNNPRHFGVLWFDNRAQEAAWVATRIQSILGMSYYEEHDGSVRGLTPADFAILMRSTREPEQDGSPRHSAYTHALTSLGIHFSLEAGGGPFERPQVSALRSTFELLRYGSLTRDEVQSYFNDTLVWAYPRADFDALARVLTDWGRRIHAPISETRRRVYPQQLVHDLLNAFNTAASNFDAEVLRDIGLFSHMIQDVEAVYMSVDSPQRFQEILNFLQNAAETGYNVSTDDVLQRPDAVTVSTVHKAKGLEYPVVFVVDVEAQRFPGRRSSYSGWLPDEVMRAALSRGAYQRNDDEEARLFYTAITRAERYLYVTGAARLPGGRKQRSPSRFANALTHCEISTNPDELPANLQPCTPRQRIADAILPTSFSAIRYYLSCPMGYRFRQGYGFSPPIPEMFGFGKTVHTAVEKLHQSYDLTAPSGAEAESIARQVFHLKHVPQSNDPINRPGPYERAREKTVDIVQRYSNSYQQDFQRRKQVEARFEIPAKDSVITGEIDLLLKQDDQGSILEAEVIDFKAIEGGADPSLNVDIDWAELSLQVQLYAKAAQDILGENARTGSVHLLKDNQRIEVPISDAALDAAVSNVEWAVQGILNSDYPMRPEPSKCRKCDFCRLCPQIHQEFQNLAEAPPPIHLPSGEQHVRSVADS